MVALDEYIGRSIRAEQAEVLGIQTITTAPTKSCANGLTATGTVIADALQLTTFNSQIATAAVATGVKLPAGWPIGEVGLVQNDGANPLNLFPPTAAVRLNGGTLGAAITIAAAAGNIIIRLSATNFAAYVVAKEA